MPYSCSSLAPPPLPKTENLLCTAAGLIARGIDRQAFSGLFDNDFREDSALVSSLQRQPARHFAREKTGTATISPLGIGPLTSTHSYRQKHGG